MSIFTNILHYGSMKKSILLGSVALFAMATPHLALAQSASNTQKGDVPEVETIVVTGSSIRGVAPVGSALIGVNKESIQAIAPANTKELLASIPQLGNFGANAEQSTPNRFRSGGFDPNIHNLGIYATLGLVNGHRIAQTGTEAVFPDPSMIPVIAIQRVEVVADGGSAIYGSDAVAGVVNFIYRKPVDTVEASATYGTGVGRYEKRDFAGLWGKTWSGGGIMAAYEHSENKSPYDTDISFLALGSDQTSRGGRDLRSNACLLPRMQAVKAGNPPSATGTAYQYSSLSTAAVDQRCGLLTSQTVIPDGKRNAFLVTANQDITNKLRVWTEVNYSKYDTVNYSNRQTLALVVPRTNPYFPTTLPASLANAQSIFVTRNGLGLFPGRIRTQYAEFTGVTLGGDIDFGSDWKGTLMLHVSRTRDFNNDPELDLQNAQAAAYGTTKDTALNPFGQAADNNPAVLAKINNGFTQANKASQRLRDLSFKTDGPLFALPGGEVRAAFGVEIRDEQMKQLQVGGGPQSSYYKVLRNDNLERVVTSSFGELSVPIVGDANELPFVHSLTLSLAGRADYYPAYGTKYNPKVGLVWSPTPGVSLHGSYGTSFAAPNLGLITSPFSVPQPNTNQTGFTIASGPYAGEKLGVLNQLNISNGHVPGTPDLQPETANTYSLGVDLQPTWSLLDGLRLSATYYHVEYNNTIYKPVIADILTNPDFVNHFILHPTQAQVAAALAAYPPQQPVTYGIDLLYDAFAINIGSKVAAGVDLDASYRLTTDFGNFNFGANANRQTTYDIRLSNNGRYTNRLGTSDAPKWKSRLQLGWNYKQVTLNTFVNYVSGFRNTTITPNQNVDSFTTVDVSASYELPKLMNGVTLQVRAANAFDKDPPFYDAAAGYFPALASPFGRTVDLTVRAKF